MDQPYLTPQAAPLEPAQPLPPHFLSRPFPAAATGSLGCVGYLLLAQLLPGVFIGIYLAVTGQLENVEQAVTSLLWFITFWGVGVSILLVWGSRAMGWLDRGPEAPAQLWQALAWIVALCVACPLGSEAITWVQSRVLSLPLQEQEAIVSAARQGGLAFYLAIVVGAPLGEELFFRRWMYGLTRRPLGKLGAFLLSGLAFALIHFNLSGFLAYLWIAGCCTLAYERSGSLAGAVAVHFVNNAIAGYTLQQSLGS